MVWGAFLSTEINEDKTRDLAIAASAKVNSYTVATRNIDDFRDRGVRLLNPFERPPAILEIN
jgi:hypothetical protein